MLIGVFAPAFPPVMVDVFGPSVDRNFNRTRPSIGRSPSASLSIAVGEEPMISNVAISKASTTEVVVEERASAHCALWSVHLDRGGRSSAPGCALHIPSPMLADPGSFADRVGLNADHPGVPDEAGSRGDRTAERWTLSPCSRRWRCCVRWKPLRRQRPSCGPLRCSRCPLLCRQGPSHLPSTSR